MMEESNTDITKNNQINSRVEETDVVTQEPEWEIDDNADSGVVDIVAQEPAWEIDNNADSGVIDVVAQEPAWEIDNNADSGVVDVVTQASVVENSPAVAQSNSYQTMIEASIQVLQKVWTARAASMRCLPSDWSPSI